MFSSKDLQRLIVPLIVERILLMLVGIVNTVMTSYTGGTGMSGVALVDTVNYLTITALLTVTTGGVVVVSQYPGSEERENANRAVSQLFPTAFLMSVGIMVLCLLFYREILGALSGGVEAEVMRVAQDYLFITSYSFPFLGVYNSLSALFRSMNRTKIIIYASFLMSVIDVARNAVGIFTFHVGVAGVAVPTPLSRVVVAVIMPILSMQSKYEICITWRNLVPWNQEIAVRVLRIAIPSGVENGPFALGRILVTSIIALFGTTQIAANGMAGSIDQIASITTSAMNLAIVPVMEQYIGAGEHDQATYYAEKFMKTTYVLIDDMGGIIIVILPFIFGFYELLEETCRINVLPITLHSVLVPLLHPTSFVLANNLRATGGAEITMYIGIGSMVAFWLGTAVLFGIIFKMRVAGAWAAMGMDWSTGTIALSMWYKSGEWRCVKVI